MVRLGISPKEIPNSVKPVGVVLIRRIVKAFQSIPSSSDYSYGLNK